MLTLFEARSQRASTRHGTAVPEALVRDIDIKSSTTLVLSGNFLKTVGIRLRQKGRASSNAVSGSQGSGPRRSMIHSIDDSRRANILIGDPRLCLMEYILPFVRLLIGVRPSPMEPFVVPKSVCSSRSLKDVIIQSPSRTQSNIFMHSSHSRLPFACFTFLEVLELQTAQWVLRSFPTERATREQWPYKECHLDGVGAYLCAYKVELRVA